MPEATTWRRRPRPTPLPVGDRGRSGPSPKAPPTPAETAAPAAAAPAAPAAPTATAAAPAGAAAGSAGIARSGRPADRREAARPAAEGRPHLRQPQGAHCGRGVLPEPQLAAAVVRPRRRQRARQGGDHAHPASPADGLIPTEYKIPDLASAASPDAQAEAELRFTATLITFTRHLQAGRFPFERMGGEIMLPQEPPDVTARSTRSPTPPTSPRRSTSSARRIRAIARSRPSSPSCAARPAKRPRSCAFRTVRRCSPARKTRACRCCASGSTWRATRPTCLRRGAGHGREGVPEGQPHERRRHHRASTLRSLNAAAAPRRAT